jgi:zinc protease
MPRRTRAFLLLLPAAAVLLSLRALAVQQIPAAVASLKPADPMPVDAAISQGTLPNGLRYYVRANRKPEKRAELRLVVKAGSILEDDDQQGLAHVVEHMAFNGTQHFPKHEVVQFLESLGMRFGADVNAYTSFDETVYMLTVPTDQPAVLDRALLILEDWAHHVTFDPAEIDKERPVVMEEWRLRRGAGARISDRMLPILLAGSRYADRVPIGKTEVLQTFKPERLTRFYADWYRPDLMAVVVVGDVDQAQVVGLVTHHFSGLTNPPNPRTRPSYDVPDRNGTAFAVLTDKELTMTDVEVDYFVPTRPYGTVGVYRQRMIDRLFGSMLSARLAEIAQKPDAPFLGAGTGRGTIVGRTKDNTSISATVKDGGSEKALETMLAEVERVVRFGFTPGELDRQKQNILRSRERALAEKDSVTAGSRADEYVRNFLTGETLPSLEDEYGLVARFADDIALSEINRMATEWYPALNRVVIVRAPEKAGVTLPDEASLTAALKAGPSGTISAYVDRIASATLLETVPEPSPVVKTSAREALGVTEWQLANGVTVVIKPTTFRQDEVMFRAFSPGGTSQASDADFVPASTATQVVTAGGLGRFSSAELRKVLTGKIASANPTIGELDEGIVGSASPKDLETMFQLIYMRFTQPRADADIFATQTSQLKTLMANQANTPGFAFTSALAEIMGQNSPRRRLPTPAMIDEWNLDKSLAFYKDRFADASDFTFVFVGNIDPAVMKPLAERYLGSLPSTHRRETWKDVGVRAPKGVITKQVVKGIEPKSQATIVYTGGPAPGFTFTQDERIALRAMGEILQTRLLETIREDLGGTYSITARASAQRIPYPEFSVTISFGCDPKRLDDLVARVYQEVDTFRTDGPTDAQVADEREALLRGYETASRQNAFWMGQLLAVYEGEAQPGDPLTAPDAYKRLSADSIRAAARTYLKGDNRVQLTLVPEGK